MKQILLQFIFVRRPLFITLGFYFFFFEIPNLLASGNSNIIVTTSTANGSWSFAGSTYTWTPNANGSTVKNTDIQNCLLGTGALGGSGIVDAAVNGVGSVIILTACSGVGTENGDVGINSTITAATTSTSALTFTITASGYVDLNATLDLTPASNGSTGYPATALVWTGPTAIHINFAITLNGGVSTSANAAGGAAGTCTFTSASGPVHVYSSISAIGAGGGTGSTGADCHGGAGGAITISAYNIESNQPINVSGGGATGTGNGGIGGAITMTSNSTTIDLQNNVLSNGGVGGTGNGAPGNGGNGGAISFTSQTGFYNSGSIANNGGSGAGDGNGGNGGGITVSSVTGSINIYTSITSSGGASGTSITNQSGGNGGAISMTAVTTCYGNGGSISCSGGTCRGTGSSNGGTIAFTGPGGFTFDGSITSSAGTGGAAGTGGTLTISTNYATVTSSNGVNDGQTNGGSWVIGALVKLGTGILQLTTTSNSWSGNTTVTAGTLQIGAAGVIPNSSNVVMNGGRLNGYYSETMGTLNLNAGGSKIYLGTGNHTLNFAASAGVAWAGNFLYIYDWLGGYNCTAAGVSDPKIFVGSGNNTGVDLTAGQLAKITFYRASNTQNYTACQLATGEVVPTSTLPVELISFEGKKEQEGVELKWETASEINSDFYDVLRSTDDKNFESIGKVPAANNSSTIKSYTFLDASPKSGVNYYRLFEYDFDGQHQESQVVAIDFRNKVDMIIQIYPNPSSGKTTFIFSSEQGGMYRLNICSVLGEIVYSALVAGIPGENKFDLNFSEFANGNYFISIVNPQNVVSTTKFVKE